MQTTGCMGRWGTSSRSRTTVTLTDETSRSLSVAASPKRTVRLCRSAHLGLTSCMERTILPDYPSCYCKQIHPLSLSSNWSSSSKPFPSALPAKRDVRHHAWVSISVGCNNACTFCIVPSLRGPEQSRRMGDIVREVQQLVR
jgi:tRNA A37 methylthiotransferase MiaB